MLAAGLDQGLGTGSCSSHHQGLVGGQQCFGNLTGKGLRLGIQTLDRRGIVVNVVGHGKTEARLIIHGRHADPGGDIIQPGAAEAGDEQRRQLVLGDVLDRQILPDGGLAVGGHLHRLVLDRLAKRQGNTRRRLRHVLTQHQHAILAFDVAQRGDRQCLRSAGLAAARCMQPNSLSCNTAVEVGRSHQRTQGEVGFQAGAR